MITEFDMGTIFGLLAMCCAPFVGVYLGDKIVRKEWLSSVWRVFLASSALASLFFCMWSSNVWFAFFLLSVGVFAIRRGRAYWPHYNPHAHMNVPDPDEDAAEAARYNRRPTRYKFGHVRLAVDNGHFPILRETPKRGKLRSVK